MTQCKGWHKGWIGSKKGEMLQLSEAWHWSPLFISTALHLPRSANTEQANRGLQRAIILIVKRERTQIIRISQNNFLFSRSQRNWQIFKQTFKCTCLYNIVNKTSFDKFALLLYKLSVKKARHLFDSTFIASLSFAKKTFGKNSKTTNERTNEQTVKIELLSQWKLEAEFRNNPVFFCRRLDTTR